MNEDKVDLKRKIRDYERDLIDFLFKDDTRDDRQLAEMYYGQEGN